MKNNARLELSELISIGMNPRTGLPQKVESGTKSHLYSDLLRLLEDVDEKDAINRYTWYNLPKGLTPQLIERILYYRGSGMIFKLEDKFFFLPYSLSGTIDIYGRFMKVTPLPFNGTVSDDGDIDRPWIQGLDFVPVYDIPTLDEFIDKSEEEIEEYLNTSCVILHDRSPQISQTIIPKSEMMRPLIGMMSECLPFMRTALLNSTGISGMKVGNEDEKANVYAASSSINRAALCGEKFVPITANNEFQELTGGTVARSEEFLLTLQSLDNLRLSMHGLDSGGLFQKKSHMLEAEQEMNQGNSGLLLMDGLNLRQDFSTMVNIIFGESMWCEVSEPVLGIDRDGDGEAGAENDSEEVNVEEEEVDVDE